MEICGFKSFKLSWTEKGIMSCSGTIRGAIAFGLSISIKSKVGDVVKYSVTVSDNNGKKLYENSFETTLR